MRLPYGISNFADLHRGGYVFVDKTPFIMLLTTVSAQTASGHKSTQS